MSSNFIAVAKHIRNELGHVIGTFEFCERQAQAYVPLRRTIDLAVSMDALGDIASLCNEICRVTVAGGRVVRVERSRPSSPP